MRPRTVAITVSRSLRREKKWSPAAREPGCIGCEKPSSPETTIKAAFNYEPISSAVPLRPWSGHYWSRDAAAFIVKYARPIIALVLFARPCFSTSPPIAVPPPPICFFVTRPVVKKLNRARKWQKHANFSFMIINSRSAPSPLPLANTPGRSRMAQKKAVLWWIEPLMRYFHVRALSPWTYIRANLCYLSIKRRRA